MSNKAAALKRPNQSPFAINKERFAVPVILQPSARLSAAEQCLADGFLHSFSRGIAHSSRALLFAVAVSHDSFQGLGITRGNLISPTLLRLDLPLQMQLPNFDLHFIRESIKDQHSVESVEDFRAHLVPSLLDYPAH